MSGDGERPEELSWDGQRQSTARPYRPDIDGLRAVAVLAVIAFHVKFSAFPGGYIGVDVFFVISGYLIGSIILEEVGAGRFSLLAFYERRARRIFPALAALLILLSVPAYLYLLPNELAAYGGSVLAATFSVSNFYFLLHTGYFAAPAYYLPLLHTWSLAIEEQFYIFLPLFILLLHRFVPKLLPSLILAATALSFVLCLHETGVNQAAAFYLPWTRAWELLLGTLIALGLFAQPRTPLWRNIAALAGLALIIGPAATFNAATAFPGANALAPCLGAALIIAAGRSGGSWVAQLLSCRPLVFIGRISYSLYLWHWPVIVFMIMSGLTPSTHQPSWLKFLAVVASVILATLSWRYVETPFRRGPRRPSRRRLFAMAGGAAAVLVALGLTGTLSQGLPGRFPAQSAAIAGYLDYDWGSKGYFRLGSCFLDTGLAFQPFLAGGCVREDGKRPSDLILGDSHAAHLWYGLSKVFPGVNFLQATSPLCKPFLAQPPWAEPVCRRVMKYVFEDFLLHHKIDRLILAGAWSFYDLEPLAETLDWARAHGVKTTLVGPIVVYDDMLPRLIVLSIRDKDPGLVDRHRADLATLDQAMRQLAAKKGAAYVSLVQAICGQGSCATLAAPDIPLQFDIAHLTPEGSIWLARRLAEMKALP